MKSRFHCKLSGFLARGVTQTVISIVGGDMASAAAKRFAALAVSLLAAVLCALLMPSVQMHVRASEWKSPEETVLELSSAYVRKELLRDSGENGGRASSYEPVVLASVTSSYQQNNNSVKNAKVACDYVNGTVLRAGEEFSFNKVIGERTRKNGYVSAPSIAGDQLEMTIGGGICQVSSMLYNVSLRTGMKIRERHAHSLVVPYAANGFDASVVWGQWDYRFVNPYDTSIAMMTMRHFRSI